MTNQTAFISDFETVIKKVPHCWSQSKKVVSAIEAAYKAQQPTQVWGCEQPEIKPQCTALVPYQAPVKPNMMQAAMEWVKPRLKPALVTVALLALRMMVAALIWIMTEPRAFLDKHHLAICNGLGVAAYQVGRVAFHVYSFIRFAFVTVKCWIVLAKA